MNSSILGKLKPKTQFEKDCFDLYREYKNGTLTNEQLDLALAGLTIQNIDLFGPKHPPLMPEPLLKLKEKMALPDWQKKSHMVKEQLMNQVYDLDEVRYYIVEKLRIKSENISDMEWLNKCLGFFPDSLELKNKIKEFKIIC